MGSFSPQGTAKHVCGIVEISELFFNKVLIHIITEKTKTN
jgi:hypothetical protein